MDTVSKFPRQLVPTVGQIAAASGVKFRPGSPSIPGERVASGLVWRFSTLDCISDNLDYFGNSFGSGSFLDIGSHCFYVAKPFSEEVTDVLDPLCDADSENGEISDFCSMVEVLALEEDGGGGPSRSARPPLECSPPPEHGLPPPERTCWTQPSRTCALHSTSLRIRSRSPRIWSGRASTSSRKRSTSMTLVAHGFTPAGDGPSRAGQVRQRGRELGAELNPAAPSAKLPPIINKPTYSTPTKNLRVARYITSELDGLQGEDLREKQARIQELLNAADLQQQAMEPRGEVSGT
jgi:hypothetical protein